MNEITIKGKKAKVKFGNWVVEHLTVTYGYDIQDLQNILKSQSSGFIPKALHLGLCQVAGRNLEAFNLNDVYDYVDEVGLLSKTLEPIISQLTNDLSVALTGETTNSETVEVKEKVTKKK